MLELIITLICVFALPLLFVMLYKLYKIEKEKQEIILSIIKRIDQALYKKD